MPKTLKFLALFLLAIAVIVGSYFYTDIAKSIDKGPGQPILFSHKIHAGENEIPCQTCHSYTDVSRNPGIPSVQRCYGCHSQIKGRDIDYTTKGGQTINLKNEIAKVVDYWDRKEPIPWIKVTTMPEYVHFNHKRHIKRGFECATCHGEVKEMDVVYKAKSLKMGFCISCHEQNADNEQHHAELRDCLTCHY
ncbi:MAG: cytochrome c3 family protein [Thermodesulfobacteriota bacterium]